MIDVAEDGMADRIDSKATYVDAADAAKAAEQIWLKQPDGCAGFLGTSAICLVLQRRLRRRSKLAISQQRQAAQ